MEHCDRLARFGVERLQAALAFSGPRLVAGGSEGTSSDLVGDITAVGTCARLYGQRDAKNRAGRAIAVATGEIAQ